VECREFSLIRAIASQVPGLNVDAGRERELSRELERRSGRAAGGIMVPTTVFEKRIVTTTTPAGGPGANVIATDWICSSTAALGEELIERQAEAALAAVGGDGRGRIVRAHEGGDRGAADALARASLANCCFHPSNPAAELPHCAALASPAAPASAARAAAATLLNCPILVIRNSLRSDEMPA